MNAMNDPIAIEQEALQAQRRGDYQTAVDLWLRLVEQVNNWEHGYAHYSLAGCYALLRRFDDAEKHYAEAARIAPEDKLFSDALSDLVKARANGLV